MSDVNVLPVSTREGVGKGAARAARREGLVPAVIYGAGESPQPVNIKQNELLKALKRGKFLAALLDLELDGGKKVRVIPKEVQRDVVLDLPTHVDFLRLSDRSMITLFVAIEFQNEDKAPGLEKGGVMTVISHEVRIRCRAGAIPENIPCDLSGLGIGDSIGRERLTLPAGVMIAETNPDFTVANISAPKGIGGGGDEASEGDAEGAEEPAEGGAEG